MDFKIECKGGGECMLQGRKNPWNQNFGLKKVPFSIEVGEKARRKKKLRTRTRSIDKEGKGS